MTSLHKRAEEVVCELTVEPFRAAHFLEFLLPKALGQLSTCQGIYFALRPHSYLPSSKNSSAKINILIIVY